MGWKTERLKATPRLFTVAVGWFLAPDLWNEPRVHRSQLLACSSDSQLKGTARAAHQGQVIPCRVRWTSQGNPCGPPPPALLWTIPNYSTSQWEGLFRKTFLGLSQSSAFLMYLFKGPGNLWHQQHWCQEQMVLGSRFWSSTYCMWCDLRWITSSFWTMQFGSVCIYVCMCVHMCVYMFTGLCNCHCNLIPEHSHHPQKKAISSQLSLIPLPSY